jgi:predicted MPP superfamily phosphohydrolase
MKRHQLRFYLVFTLVFSLTAGSAFFTSHEILHLTQSKIAFSIWAVLSVFFQGPFLLLPLDRGRTLGAFSRKFPQWLFLALVGFNLTQIFLVLLFPVFLFVPNSIGLLGYFPFVLYLLVLVVVFRAIFNVVEVDIKLKFEGLPKNWTPLTILHLSDIHSGPFMKYAHLEKVVERLNKKEFDICVVTGDVVNHSAKDLTWTLTLLEKLKSTIGTFAAIGNHEYIDDEKKIIEIYNASKIELLIKSSKYLSKGGNKIRLIGVDYPFDSERTGRDEVQNALATSFSNFPLQEGEFQILLSHHPNGFEVAKELRIPLTLAGHTHGGQIEVANKSIVGAFVKYIKGIYEFEDHFMYVNSGLGNWLPFRLNVPCEYAIITVEATS